MLEVISNQQLIKKEEAGGSMQIAHSATLKSGNEYF